MCKCNAMQKNSTLSKYRKIFHTIYIKLFVFVPILRRIYWSGKLNMKYFFRAAKERREWHLLYEVINMSLTA